MYIVYDNRMIEYEIIIKKIKNTYIKIIDNKVIITTSKYYDKNSIIKYLEDNFDSIYKKIIANKKQNDVITLFNNNKIYYKGFEYDLIYLKGKDDYYIDNFNFYLITNHDPIKFIEKIYKETIEKEINKVIDEVKKTFNNKYNPKIVVKKLTSCYGNNYINKNIINMSLYLAKFDLKYTKFILYHEFCHFKERNHGKGFYSLMDNVYPNHRIINKELKEKTKLISLK